LLFYISDYFRSYRSDKLYSRDHMKIVFDKYSFMCDHIFIDKLYSRDHILFLLINIAFNMIIIILINIYS